MTTPASEMMRSQSGSFIEIMTLLRNADPTASIAAGDGRTLPATTRLSAGSENIIHRGGRGISRPDVIHQLVDPVRRCGIDVPVSGSHAPIAVPCIGLGRADKRADTAFRLGVDKIGLAATGAGNQLVRRKRPQHGQSFR